MSTAGLSSKRSSMRKCRNSYCATIVERNSADSHKTCHVTKPMEVSFCELNINEHKTNSEHKAHCILPLPLNKNHFTVFTGGPAHWLAVLELVLPRFNQLGGLTEVLDLVTFTVLHSTCQRVCGRGRISDGMPPCSKAVVDLCFRPGALNGMRLILSLWEIMFSCPSCLSTDRFTSRPSVADFPEGAAQFCTRCFVCGPQEQSSSSCRRSWSFWARSSSSATSEATACNTSPSSCSYVHLFHGDFEARACVVFWFMSQALLFASAFFLQVALRLPFLLFSKRWRSPVARASAESQVVDACVTPAASSVTARPWFLLRLSTTSTSVIIVGTVAASDPLAPPRNNCSSCVASREEPNPCYTRRTLDHTPANSETCSNTKQMCVGQQTVCQRTEMTYALEGECKLVTNQQAHRENTAVCHQKMKARRTSISVFYLDFQCKCTKKKRTHCLAETLFHVTGILMYLSVRNLLLLLLLLLLPLLLVLLLHRRMSLLLEGRCDARV